MIDGIYDCTIFCDTGMMKLTHRGNVELRVRNGRLSGTMISTFFWLPSCFRDGKADGDRFCFTALWNSPCQQYAMEVEGRVDDDILTGIARTSIGKFTLEGRRIAA